MPNIEFTCHFRCLVRTLRTVVVEMASLQLGVSMVRDVRMTSSLEAALEHNMDAVLMASVAPTDQTMLDVRSVDSNLIVIR